jgi:zinc/manganese transport system permease protein
VTTAILAAGQLADPLEPRLTWDLVADVRELFRYAFMINAVEAGTVVAALAAVVGWLMVLRRQSFTGHTVALIGFPGAAGALALGVSAGYGFFAFSIAGALVIAASTTRGRLGPRSEAAVTGTVQATALALGYWFSTLYGGFTGGGSALLFGSFLGITATQVQTLSVITMIVLAVMVLIGRPLLFASVDPTVALARRVPARALSLAFLLVLALTAASAAQITGVLLVFALLVGPAATAQRLTAHPVHGIALAVAIGVLATWTALFLAYYIPYPIGFFLTSTVFAAYLAATALARVRGDHGRRARASTLIEPALRPVRNSS